MFGQPIDNWKPQLQFAGRIGTYEQVIEDENSGQQTNGSQTDEENERDILRFLHDLNAECIADLSNLPFDPYIRDLLSECLALSQGRLSYKVLSIVGKGHAKNMSTLQYSSITLPRNGVHVENLSVLRDISTSFPWFIYRLNLSFSKIGDNDMWHLNSLIHLVVLDLTCTLITDLGVGHISRMASLEAAMDKDRGLQSLQVLSLAGNPLVTDAALKYLIRLGNLQGLDLSSTNVSGAAQSVFSGQGYQILCASNRDIDPFYFPYHESSLISWDDGYLLSPSTMKQLGDLCNPGYQISCMIATDGFQLPPDRSTKDRSRPYSYYSYINRKRFFGLQRLCFVRKLTAGLKRKIPPSEARKMKEPKIRSTDEYLAMVRKEFGL